jgi:hypothetical protein
MRNFCFVAVPTFDAGMPSYRTKPAHLDTKMGRMAIGNATRLRSTITAYAADKVLEGLGKRRANFETKELQAKVGCLCVCACVAVWERACARVWLPCQCLDGGAWCGCARVKGYALASRK